MICPRCALLPLVRTKVNEKTVLTCSIPGCFNGSLKDFVKERKTNAKRLRRK